MLPKECLASCTSIWYIWGTPGSKSVVGAVHARRDPAVRAHSMPSHGTSAGRTQGTCVSAPSHLSPSQTSVTGRDRVVLPGRLTWTAYADGSEVSPDLGRARPARPATAQTAHGRPQLSHPVLSQPPSSSPRPTPHLITSPSRQTMHERKAAAAVLSVTRAGLDRRRPRIGGIYRLHDAHAAGAHSLSCG